MFFAVLARGDITTPDMIKKYREVYRNMEPDIYEVTEILTGLNVPQLLDQLESLNRQIESRKGQLEALSVNSVRALRGVNFTAEEISERLKLDLSEVNRILKANGGGA
jgi:hypothetical protein